MRNPVLSVSLLSLILCGCSALPPREPTDIPPPPVELMAKCPQPQPLPDVAAANELADTLMQALRYGACEHGMRLGILEAWPR